jgi:outer membrane protein TolC
MKKWLYTVFLLFGTGFFTPAQAQTLLSRAAILRLSEKSASVEVAKAWVSSAEVQAQAAGLPISGSVQVLSSISGIVPNSGETVFSYPSSLQLNLRFAGVWGQAAQARIQAGVALERARRGLLAARLRAQGQALNLWHNLRLGLANLELAQLGLAIAKQEDLAAQTRFTAGGISIAERERVGLALEVAQLNLARAEVQLSGVRLQMGALFGLREVLPEAWTPIQERVFTVAQLENREDIFEARVAVSSAELERSSTQQSILPTLNLDVAARGSAGALTLGVNQHLAVSLGYAYPYTSPAGVSSSFSVGVSLSIPLQPFGFGTFTATNRQLSAAQSGVQVAFLLAQAEATSKQANFALAQTGLGLANRELEFLQRQVERGVARLEVGLSTGLEQQKILFEQQKSALQQKNAQAEVDKTLLELYTVYAVPLEAM